MDIRSSVADALKRVTDDNLKRAQYDMFLPAALLGTDQHNLAKIDLLQVCVATAWKHLNDKVSHGGNKENNRKAEAITGTVMSLSVGESLMEVINPSTITLACMSILRGIFKILSKDDPPSKPSKREDNIVPNCGK
jgi:hypothetical protein